MIKADLVVVRKLPAEPLLQEALLLKYRLQFETEALCVMPFEASGHLSSAYVARNLSNILGRVSHSVRMSGGILLEECRSQEKNR